MWHREMPGTFSLYIFNIWRHGTSLTLVFIFNLILKTNVENLFGFMLMSIHQQSFSTAESWTFEDRCIFFHLWSNNINSNVSHLQSGKNLSYYNLHKKSIPLEEEISGTRVLALAIIWYWYVWKNNAQKKCLNLEAYCIGILTVDF